MLEAGAIPPHQDDAPIDAVIADTGSRGYGIRHNRRRIQSGELIDQPLNGLNFEGLGAPGFLNGTNDLSF